MPIPVTLAAAALAAYGDVMGLAERYEHAALSARGYAEAENHPYADRVAELANVAVGALAEFLMAYGEIRSILDL